MGTFAKHHSPYAQTVFHDREEDVCTERGLHSLVANVEQNLTVPVPFYPCSCEAHDGMVAKPSGLNDGITSYEHPAPPTPEFISISEPSSNPSSPTSSTENSVMVPQPREMEFRMYVAMIPTWWIDKSHPGLELQELINTVVGCPHRCRVSRTALMPPDCRCNTCSGRQFSNTKFRADLIATPENMAMVLCALQGRVVFGEKGFWYVNDRRVYSSMANALTRINKMPVHQRHEMTELLPSQPLAFEMMKRQRGGKRSIAIMEDALRRLNLRPYKGIVVGV